MKQSDILYSAPDQEHLYSSIIEAVARVVEDSLPRPGESFDAAAARIQWPIELRVFKRMSVSRYVDHLADDALERILENLDEEHADPDGDATEPTPGMVAAAKSFAQAVVNDYVSWACEPTGEVVLVTCEDARKMRMVCL